MKYIDIHCHLNFPDFDADRDEAIKRAQEAGVGMIIVGTTRETSRRAVEIAESHENIWAIVGLHPIYAGEEDFDRDYYLQLARHDKVVGIGECGYDYYRAPVVTFDQQHAAFLGQISIANEVGKPLMLHLRSGSALKEKPAPSTGATGVNAYADALVALQRFHADHDAHPKVIGDAHFFAGTVEEAKAFLDLGFYISCTGVVTFARSYDDVIRSVPLDRLMCETDAPYVTPVPYCGERGNGRGKTDGKKCVPVRNEPLFVTAIAHKIAEIRGEPESVVLPALVENAKRLFKLK